MEMVEIRGAVARGWGYPRNAEKVMDVDLAEAISVEIKKLFTAFREPQLGCATTRQLIDELVARLDMDMDYRTIDSD